MLPACIAAKAAIVMQEHWLVVCECGFEPFNFV
jgi:hypothetical protein